MDQTPLGNRRKASMDESFEDRDPLKTTASDIADAISIKPGSVPEMFYSDNEDVLAYMRQNGFTKEEVDSMEVVLYTEEPIAISPYVIGYSLPPWLAKIGLSKERIDFLMEKMRSAGMFSGVDRGKRCDCPVSRYSQETIRTAPTVVSSDERRRSIKLIKEMKVVSYWANIPEGVKVIPKDCFERRMSFYIFPPGLKAIDDRAFENEGMGSINLPEGLESIGFRAFFNAGTARTLNIPDSVRYIGPQALVLQCLEKIEVSSRNMHYTSLRGVLFDKDVKTLIKYPKMMEEDVYYVPDTVETIADYAFYQANISKVVLPKRLKRIGAAAFQNSKIGSIDLPDSIESLGEWAFANAEIPSLEVPSKIKHIPKRAFGSGYILSLRFRGAPISIGEEAFCTCRARYQEIPDSVEYIGKEAFFWSRLEGIRLPKNLKHLGAGVFKACNHLFSITIPPSVRFIPDSAFDECEGLRSVELSGDTFHIGEKAFNHCYSLSQIYLGASLRSVGPCAFLECRSLKDVRLPGTLRFVGQSAFQNSGLRSVNVPISTGIVDKWGFWCDRMHSATVYPQTKLVKDAFTPRTNVVVLSDMPKKKTEEEDGEGFLAKLKKLF